MPPEREAPEYSELGYRKGREAWVKEVKRPQVNQVCSSKNFTESAGPLQFKSFVNRVIKPQFMSKKSNIYEDPQGEDAEDSPCKYALPTSTPTQHSRTRSAEKRNSRQFREE
jgi:hypothetical protein